jgi:hypothetical protein
MAMAATMAPPKPSTSRPGRILSLMSRTTAAPTHDGDNDGSHNSADIASDRETQVELAHDPDYHCVYQDRENYGKDWTHVFAPFSK